MTRRIVVVGAGIVGAAVAEQLAAREGCTVTVIDRAGRGELPGSTGHAPGYVGVVAEDPALTELARESVAVYQTLQWRGQSGFEQIGALEVAHGPEGVRRVAARAELAASAGVPAKLLETAEAVRLAPRLTDPARVTAAVLLPFDGAARADVITAALCARAEAAGARFVHDSPVKGLETRGDRVTAVQTASELFPADDVVIACGIWGPAVAALAGVTLPLVPVTHPYVYSERHVGTYPPSPLVRWPEFLVYARDHGDRFGLGTSNHDPLVVPEPAGCAQRPWPGGILDSAVTCALELQPPEHRWRPVERIAGLLSITPDRLPLLGPSRQLDGLWLAEAIWITHAAGAAKALVALMFGKPATVAHLHPDRFAGVPTGELHLRAEARYRDLPERPAGRTTGE